MTLVEKTKSHPHLLPRKMLQSWEEETLQIPRATLPTKRTPFIKPHYSSWFPLHLVIFFHSETILFQDLLQFHHFYAINLSPIRHGLIEKKSSSGGFGFV